MGAISMMIVKYKRLNQSSSSSSPTHSKFAQLPGLCSHLPVSVVSEEEEVVVVVNDRTVAADGRLEEAKRGA